MARGGHHGGGFHGGGHHGGGFHGGVSFGGGSFYGGGYHGGGYHGGGNDGGFDEFIIGIAFFVILGLAYFVYAVAVGAVPGLNIINLCMFVASIVFYFLSLKDYDRTSAIYHLHQKDIFPKLQVWNAEYKNYGLNSVSDKVSWAGKYENKYRIAFYDRDFGDENIRKVEDLIKRTPKIIWMESFVWLIIGFFSTASNAVFYEWLIPYFENMEMTDEAFAFVDELVFYTPAGFTLLCAISCYVFMVIRDNLLHECAMRIVEDNNAAFERMKTEGSIASILNSKWYYNYCPNCGAEANNDMRVCNHCGTSLEVKDITKDQVSAVHLISAEEEITVLKPEVKRHTD